MRGSGVCTTFQGVSAIVRVGVFVGVVPNSKALTATTITNHCEYLPRAGAA
jgi:hypothetical protein